MSGAIWASATGPELQLLVPLPVAFSLVNQRCALQVSLKLVLRSYHHVTVGLTVDHVWGDTGTGGAHEAFGSGTTQFGIYLNEPSVVQRPTGAASVGARTRPFITSTTTPVVRTIGGW